MANESASAGKGVGGKPSRSSTPKKEPRHDTSWYEKFFEHFRITGNLTESAELAEVGRALVYYHLERYDDFKTQFENAEQESHDSLEREAYRRALEGVEEPVFYQGSTCGAIRKYSDTLLIFLLKARRPNKFRERADLNLSGGLTVEGWDIVGKVTPDPKSAPDAS